MNDEFKPYPASRRSFLFLSIIPVLFLVVVLVIVAAKFHAELSTPSVARGCIVFLMAAGLLVGANRVFFPPERGLNEPGSVRYVISFDSVIFIIVGLAATTLSCDHWAPACLLAGSCLLIGGFFGLLFGYPQGVAQQTAQAKTGVVAVQPATREKNLLADSAATLGKVLTGFTLAKLNTVSGHFWSLSYTLGQILGAQDPKTNNVLAALILVYFLGTGFLSGLLLPSYFMSDFLNNSIGAGGPPGPPGPPVQGAGNAPQPPPGV